MHWKPVVFNFSNTPFHGSGNARREKSFGVLYTLEASFSPRKVSVHNVSHAPNVGASCTGAYSYYLLLRSFIDVPTL